MRHLIVFLSLSLLFVGCQQKIAPADISKLNGYWEIEKVVFDDGEDKNYTINETYDYFEIKDKQGIRKKVMPQLDGTFLVNATFEKLKLHFENGKAYIDYQTDYTRWTEELIVLTDNKLVLKNKEKKEYHYKRAAAINLAIDGKKTK